MKKKSYAKVNIFLKIAGRRDNYHEIVSRFVKVHSLFDVISFEKTNKNKFDIIGDFSCPLESNTIYKAYKLIKNDEKVRNFFNIYSVKVEKNIPEFAGLGGGSSNAATFLLMVNEYCNLNFSKKQLSEIALKIGADVPFFIYDYNSANVKGIGEVVESFEEEILDIETFTPKIECDTGKIFKIFREKYYKEISEEKAKILLEEKSEKILKKYKLKELNDLYEPALESNEKLKEYEKEDWYFSGSGSSFFKVNNG